MTLFNPKQGEMIQVRGASRRWDDAPRVFIAMHKGCYLCENLGNDEEFALWPAARPVPLKSKPASYSHEAWPKQAVWLRPLTDNYNKFLVIGLYSSGVRISRDELSFSILDEFYEISLDFYQTWKPCHYVPEQN